MALLCDVGQVEARFGPFGVGVNLNARWVHGLCRTCNRLGNHFGLTQWNNYVTWVKWMLVLVHLVVVLMSVKDRWTVCTEHTKGMEIFMGTQIGTPSCSVCLDIVLILTQDTCTVCAERTTGSEITFDTPNGTPLWHGSSGRLFWSIWR